MQNLYSLTKDFQRFWSFWPPGKVSLFRVRSSRSFKSAKFPYSGSRAAEPSDPEKKTLEARNKKLFRAPKPSQGARESPREALKRPLRETLTEFLNKFLREPLGCCVENLSGSSFDNLGGSSLERFLGSSLANLSGRIS